MSLSKDPYKSIVMTSMRCITNPYEPTKPIRYLNVIVSIIREKCFLVVNTKSLQETLSYESCFIFCDFIFLIAFSYKYPFTSSKLDNLWCLDYWSKYFSFSQ